MFPSTLSFTHVYLLIMSNLQISLLRDLTMSWIDYTASTSGREGSNRGVLYDVSNCDQRAFQSTQGFGEVGSVSGAR